MLNSALAIIIPAFNEEKSIAKVIEESKIFGHVIVVNDNSNDQTKKIAQKTGATVINNKTNQGYELAIVQGLEYSIQNKYQFAITIDADGQLPVTKITEFYNELVKNDLVVGDRFSKPRISENIAALIAKSLYGLRDPFCGMKGYNLKTLQGVDLWTAESIGTEIAIRMLKGGKKLSNLSINTSERMDESKFGKNSLKLNAHFLISFLKTILFSKPI